MEITLHVRMLPGIFWKNTLNFYFSQNPESKARRVQLKSRRRSLYPGSKFYEYWAKLEVERALKTCNFQDRGGEEFSFSQKKKE